MIVPEFQHVNIKKFITQPPLNIAHSGLSTEIVNITPMAYTIRHTFTAPTQINNEIQHFIFNSHSTMIHAHKVRACVVKLCEIELHVVELYVYVCVARLCAAEQYINHTTFQQPRVSDARQNCPSSRDHHINHSSENETPSCSRTQRHTQTRSRREHHHFITSDLLSPRGCLNVFPF